jgi:hypothetical protein
VTRQTEQVRSIKGFFLGGGGENHQKTLTSGSDKDGAVTFVASIKAGASGNDMIGSIA